MKVNAECLTLFEQTGDITTIVDPFQSFTAAYQIPRYESHRRGAGIPALWKGLALFIHKFSCINGDTEIILLLCFHLTFYIHTFCVVEGSTVLKTSPFISSECSDGHGTRQTQSAWCSRNDSLSDPEQKRDQSNEITLRSHNKLLPYLGLKEQLADAVGLLSTDVRRQMRLSDWSVELSRAVPQRRSFTSVCIPGRICNAPLVPCGRSNLRMIATGE